jgi:hypothetical protein
MGILYKDGEINYSLSDWVKGGSKERKIRRRKEEKR